MSEIGIYGSSSCAYSPEYVYEQREQTALERLESKDFDPDQLFAQLEERFGDQAGEARRPDGTLDYSVVQSLLESQASRNDQPAFAQADQESLPSVANQVESYLNIEQISVSSPSKGGLLDVIA